MISSQGLSFLLRRLNKGVVFNFLTSGGYYHNCVQIPSLFIQIYTYI